mgnify:CR=1|jgi:hypothetical protein
MRQKNFVKTGARCILSICMDPKLIIYILLGFSLLLNIILFIWMIQTEKRLKRLFQGKKGADLEDSFGVLEQRVTGLETLGKAHSGQLENHDSRIKRAVKSVPLTRFNPFPDVGGKQSFALSLIDEEGSGVVVSSLFARERMSVFAKSIKNGKGEQELSEEEKDILNISLK